MPNLSIKNVPKHEVESIRAEARRNHRTLQGQLRIIIAEAAARAERAARHERTFAEAVAELKRTARTTTARGRRNDSRASR